MWPWRPGARTRRPRIGNNLGGLSGPAIKPIALRMVHEVYRAVKVPVVGLGGIATGVDAAEFLIAGATAVEVGTASFWDPTSPVRIAKELEEFLIEERVSRVTELTGSLQTGNPPKSAPSAPFGLARKHGKLEA